MCESCFDVAAVSRSDSAMPESVIGIDIDDLRLPIKDGIRTAADMQFRAVELGAAVGEIEPRNLSASGRRHLMQFVRSRGLELAALTADYSQLRLTDSRAVQERVDRTREVISLARDVGTGIVTAGVGAMTHPESGEPSPLALEALTQIGEFAESNGIVYAVRPSHDSAERLAKVFKAVGCPSLRICLDPAAMVMSGANPLALLMRFPDQISLVHARDGTTGSANGIGHETRLGQGDVDFETIFEVLRETDFHSASIIRRTDSSNPMAECDEARGVLKRWLR